jgi:pantoate--beta-alanine ligase
VDVAQISKEMMDVLSETDRVEYVAIVDRSFRQIDQVQIGNTILLVAAWVGRPRLIDNIWV